MILFILIYFTIYFNSECTPNPSLASTLGNCYRQAVRTTDFYLLVVSGVSTLPFRGGEAKRIHVVRVGAEPQSFLWLTRPSHTKSEESEL